MINEFLVYFFDVSVIYTHIGIIQNAHVFINNLLLKNLFWKLFQNKIIYFLCTQTHTHISISH